MLSHLQNPQLSLLLLLFLIPLPILPYQSHFWYFNRSSRLNLLFSHLSSATMDLTQLFTPIKLTSSFLMQLLTWLPDWHSTPTPLSPRIASVVTAASLATRLSLQSSALVIQLIFETL
ncbi:expressed protein, partial [Phakopsora pachyrhizi]